MGGMVKPICFMHLSKSGGSTIRYLLDIQYGSGQIYRINGWRDIEDYQNLSLQQRAEFDVVAGHFGMEFYQQFERKHLLFTMLRHPVDRILSHYLYVRRMPAHEHHEMTQDMSLIDYALSGHDKDIDNGYVRQLSGVDFEIGQCEEAHLEAARNNFMKHIYTYGFTEQFDSSVERFASAFGWDSSLIDHSTRLNEAPVETKQTVTPYQYRKISEQNAYDVALYEWAADRLVNEGQQFFIKQNKTDI